MQIELSAQEVCALMMPLIEKKYGVVVPAARWQVYNDKSSDDYKKYGLFKMEFDVGEKKAPTVRPEAEDRKLDPEL